MSDSTDLPNLPKQAAELCRSGAYQESRDLLRDFLMHDYALLWLIRANLKRDLTEAHTAAQLALALAPEDEAVQRALVSVNQKADTRADRPPPQKDLAARIALTTGMTLTQARAVIWPFNGLHRPIGELLDAGTKTLKDLIWASEREIQSPRDAHLRDAARTILLTHLLGADPKEPPRPLRVMTGSRYIERQERIAVLLTGLSSGVALLLLVAALIVGGISTWFGNPYPWVTVGVYIALVVLWLLDRLVARYSRQFEQFRAGRHGEEQAVEALRAALDSRWTLFRNITIPNQTAGDIDLVLVGPSGVWVGEVKSYSGVHRNIGDRWEKQHKGRWYKLSTHPGKQARRNAERLKAYLQTTEAAVTWVQTIIIWAGEQQESEQSQPLFHAQEPQTPVWLLNELPDRVEELWHSKRALSEEQISRINKALMDLLPTVTEKARNQQPSRGEATL